MNSNLRRIRIVLVMAAIAGCSAGDGRLGNVGSEHSSPPVAAVSIINYAGPDGAGNTMAGVRSQAELIVSGKDSDDPDGAILQYLWEVADDGDTGLASADLLVRDRASVNVTVPRVSAATTIRLRLTVTSADGGSDSADAVLNVHPAADDDKFLQYPNANSKFGIVVTTLASRAAGAVTATYRLRVERRIKYRPRSASAGAAELANYCATSFENWPVAAWTDDSQPWLPEPGFDGQGESGQYILGQWNQGAGTVGLQQGVGNAVYAPQNPSYYFPIPSLDADDINRRYRSVVAPDPFRQLKGSDIGDAMVEVRITVEPTGTSPEVAFVLVDEFGQPVTNAGGQVITATNNGSGGAATLVLDADFLRRANFMESRQTAQSYYCAVDPEGRRLTLTDWLVANGFNPALPDFGADPVDAPADRPHAIYVNNYDLGFGRDMYMKRAPTSCTGPNDVKENVSGVVINYPSLEAAVRRTGAFVAVAMEYALKNPAGSACDPANRMATFYAYVPDDDGDADNDGTIEALQGLPAYRRVLSVNFDGRGEKFVPGACTVCHGGGPRVDLGAGGAYPDGGDVQATFLPWDPDSLLYAADAGSPSRADPSFSQAAKDAFLRSKYSRESQKDALREFNRMAYATYPNPTIQSAGFYPYAFYNGPRRLIEGWYGANLAGQFDSSYVPEGWQVAGIGDVNPVDVYRNVIAPNCRSCHLQQVRGGGVSPTDNRMSQFTSWADFLGYATLFPGENESVLHRYVLSSAVMPASRLTTDRFWLPASGSAGGLLAQVVRAASGLEDAPPPPGAPKVSPWPPGVDVFVHGGGSCAGSGADEVTCPAGSWITIDARPISFVRERDLVWEARRMATAAACADPALTPLYADTAGNGTSRFALRPAASGLYCVTVSAGGAVLKTWRIVI